MVEPQYSSVPTNDIIWIAANHDAKREAPNAHRHRFVFTFWRRCMTSAALCLLTAYLVHTYDKTIINKRLSSTQQKEFLNDPKPLAPWPRIAWLMSFPNSGTTYTMQLIWSVTNTTTASNYGLESTNMTGIPVHNSSPNGPFLVNATFPMPKTYIMTKTHCGGRCTECSPNAYTETLHSFERMCRSGSKLVDGNKTQLVYNDDIERAIHLIRSPFDNVVARLHLERKQWRKTDKKQELLDVFTDSKKGLRRWCRFLDKLHVKDELKTHFIDPELLEEEQRVPCHAEFYRYIQWHNLAFEVTRRKRLPTYILYYENYTECFDKTVEELLDFLHASQVAPAPVFYPGKQYSDYFEPEQYQAIACLAKDLASPETWDAIRHYFEPWM